MLSFLRKHTGLIMFVLAFIFVGLAFFGDNMAPSAPGSGGKVMTTKNESFNEKEYQTLGHNSGELAASFPSLRPMFMAMSTAPGLEKARIPAFFANRIILREEARRLGMVPSRDQVDAKIKGMPEFQREDGTYDPALFQRFVTRQLGRYGLTEADFLDLIKDKLSFDRIAALLTTGISLDGKTQEALFNSLAQKLNIKTATLSLEQFNKDNAEVSEEAIKTFWEPRKNKYMSDEERSVVVYTLTPKAKIEKDEKGAAIPKASQQIGEIGESIWEEVVNKHKGAGLDEVVKEIAKQQNGVLTLTEEKLEKITKNNFPDLLKKGFNPAAGQQGTLLDAIFAVNPNGALSDKISNVLIMEDGTVVLFQVKDIKLSEPFEFAQARELALKDYHMENDTKNMDLAAEKLRQDLVAGIADKKNFEEIAKAAKAKTSTLNELSLLDPENYDLFVAARLVNPNQITKVVKRGDDRIIAELVENTIEDSPETASQRNTFKQGDSKNAALLLYQDWFSEQFRNRDIKFTQRMQDILKHQSPE